MIKKTTITYDEGFTLVEVIVTIVVAATLAALFVNLMGKSLTGSSISAVRAQNHYELIKVVEQINIDYNNLMNAGDTNALVTLQAHIAAGNFGQYAQVTKFITFDPATHVEQSAATPGSNTLKVTLTKGDQTITTIFTK